jgi:hypothetical protein
MSGKYKVSSKDFINGLKTALFTAVFTAFYSVTLQPDFSIVTTDWMQVLVNMVNVGILAGMGYMSRKFFEDENGEMLKK